MALFVAIFLSLRAPDDCKVNPGAIESIVQHPTERDQVCERIVWNYQIFLQLLFGTD